MTENGIYCNILAVNKVYCFNSCYCMLAFCYSRLQSYLEQLASHL